MRRVFATSLVAGVVACGTRFAVDETHDEMFGDAAADQADADGSPTDGDPWDGASSAGDAPLADS